jgi:C-terminal processing protease CtpA/Prc
MKRSSIALLALVAVPALAHGQTFVAPPGPDIDKYGCTGFGYRVTLAHVTRTAETMTVTTIDSLSPAALAGLQVGDSITAINGVGIGDGPIGAHWRKPVGTSYVLNVRRDGADRAISLKSGRLGPEPTRADQRRVCAPVSEK